MRRENDARGEHATVEPFPIEAEARWSYDLAAAPHDKKLYLAIRHGSEIGVTTGFWEDQREGYYDIEGWYARGRGPLDVYAWMRCPVSPALPTAPPEPKPVGGPRVDVAALSAYLDRTSPADEEHARFETKLARDLRDARAEIAEKNAEIERLTCAEICMDEGHARCSADAYLLWNLTTRYYEDLCEALEARGPDAAPKIDEARITSLYTGLGYNAHDPQQARDVLIEVLDAFYPDIRARLEKGDSSEIAHWLFKKSEATNENLTHPVDELKPTNTDLTIWCMCSRPDHRRGRTTEAGQPACLQCGGRL